jgi:SnoaL-like domain
MAQDDRFDLARLERLERRLQALEDAEAIRNLKALYAALCDAQYDADEIAMLFTEDALWESPGLGRFEGARASRSAGYRGLLPRPRARLLRVRSRRQARHESRGDLRWRLCRAGRGAMCWAAGASWSCCAT